MAGIFSAWNCFCLLLVILCLLSEAVECKQLAKRRDVHRIILKSKNRNRPKKSPRPPGHPHGSFESSYDPYLDQLGEYSNQQQQHVRYHNHHRDHYRDFDRFNPYQHYPHQSDTEFSANRQNYHVMDIDEFNKNQDDYSGSLKGNYKGKFSENADFERYKNMMEYYNRKNEEDFRMKLMKSTQQVPYGEESLSAVASNNFPVIGWQQQNINAFKGAWNPVSTQTKLNTNTNIKEFPHQNIEELVDLTTSKAHLLPSPIIETNLTKYKATNFNFNPSHSVVYHANHKYKPVEYKNKNVKNGSYQVHEENGDSGGGGHQNLAHAASSSSYSIVRKPPREESAETANQVGFGLKTKARRTKRPAASITE